jgi:hypothetical protein
MLNNNDDKNITTIVFQIVADEFGRQGGIIIGDKVK